MDNVLRRTAQSIRFKEYLLGRDLSSRRVILQAAIAYAEKSPNEMKPQIIGWLNNVLNINNIIDDRERKEQIRFDVFWDELHTELIKSTLMHEIMHWFLVSAY
jgi:hypothetical protein